MMIKIPIAAPMTLLILVTINNTVNSVHDRDIYFEENTSLTETESVIVPTPIIFTDEVLLSAAVVLHCIQFGISINSMDGILKLFQVGTGLRQS